MLSKFYADVLPQTGYFCLFDHNTRRHYWAESHDELVQMTQHYSDQPGIYFGTASYQSIANRKQTNVRALRSLRLDIDVAKANDPTFEKCYETKKVALAAVVGFVKESQLFPTYIVSSGKGFHIYWCMDADCAPADWVPMAEGLQARGVALKLKIDSTCTIDTARILRPPTTIHHDDVRVAVLQHTGKVWNVAELRGALVSARPDPEVIQLPAVPVGRYDTSINRDAIIETTQRPPVSAIAVAEKCTALRHAASTGGNVPEPYWRAMLGLVKHTIEGENLAHEWSMGHPDYDEDQTQKKLDGWTAGPTTCAEFANHTKACESCMYRGTVRSPVLLVNPPLPVVESSPAIAVAQVPVTAASPAAPTPLRIVNTKPWEGQLPFGYDVDVSADGKVYSLFTMEKSEDETEDGQPIARKLPFTHNVWWFGQWAGASHSDEKARLTLCLLEHGRVKTYVLEQNILASLPDFKKRLADLSIHPIPGRKESQAMLDYGLNLLAKIHHAGKRLQISDHLGLRILPEGYLVATQGEHTIFPDGHIEHSMIAGHLRDVARQFHCPLPTEAVGGEWGPEVWQHIDPLAKQHVEFLQKHYTGNGMERLQVAIMMGLASPFMPFVEGKFQSGSVLPRGGLSVSLFSRSSGSGKTTAVAAAIAAYGNPADLTNDGGKQGTTELARPARLSAHGTLPNIMDEMGSNLPVSIATAISTVANGAARERVNREGGLNISAPWSLINLITTNTSQRDMIAAVQESSDAIQQRLLEINVDDMPEFNSHMRTQFTYDWMSVQQKCIGALGAVIHREIVRRGVSDINALVLSCVARADKFLAAKQGNRFQYRGLGAMFALYVVLKEIGIEIFPMQGVLAAFKQAHDAGQQFIADNVMPTNGLEILARALHDLKPNIMVTKNETQRTRHDQGSVDIVLNDRMPNPVVGRHVTSIGRTYVTVEALRNWCKERGLSEQEIVKEARKEEVFIPFGERNLSSEKFNLYKGMVVDSTDLVKCYRIDTHKLARKLGHEVDMTPVPATNVVAMRQ